jgi:hypothetical protein
MTGYWPDPEEIGRQPSAAELAIREADRALRAEIRAELRAAGEPDPWDFSDVFAPYLSQQRGIR